MGSEGADSQSTESDGTSGSTSTDSSDVGPTSTGASSSEAESTSGSTSGTETSTGPGPTCGDDIAEAGESCDGIDLGGASCASQGFDAGMIGCLPDCTGYDTSGCVTFECGNGVIEGAETCDGTDLAGSDCPALGFDAGMLACLPDCTAYDTSGCVTFECGNGVTDPGEECDDGGETAACDGNCTIAMCGDLTLNSSSGEACEAGNLGGETCVSQGFDGGMLGCSNACQLETSECYTCGDGVANPGEECDGADLGGQTCQGLGFAGGALACNGSCEHDVDECYFCGDGATDPGEQCDDGGQSPVCDVDCTFSVCGDGLVNGASGEQCDTGGESAGCDVDCAPSVCGDGVLNVAAGEQCDDGGAGVFCLPGCVPCPGGVLLQEDFSDNSAGWTLGPEWGIGPAMASAGHNGGCVNPDPDTDHTPTADNGVAGVVIGGNASLPQHGFYYLTSPTIDASGSGVLELSLWRWLNSDYVPFMQNHIQVWDGATWQTVWETGGLATTDAAWTLVTYDISAYANASLQIRIGFNIPSDGVWTCSQWNVDDVTISGLDCS